MSDDQIKKSAFRRKIRNGYFYVFGIIFIVMYVGVIFSLFQSGGRCSINGGTSSPWVCIPTTLISMPLIFYLHGVMLSYLVTFIWSACGKFKSH